MAGVGSHMGVMEAVEARCSITPEVIAFVSNKGPADAARIIEEIIVAPIAVIIWAVIAVVITVVVHRPARGGTTSQCKQLGSAQDHFQFASHDELLWAAIDGSSPISSGIVVVSFADRNLSPLALSESIVNTY